MSEAAPTQRIGKVMMILAWVAGLFLAVQWFSGIEERKRNPNQTPASIMAGDAVEVRLLANRQGHYLLNGQINGRDVTFLLDTGATFVAIPASVAQRLQLTQGRRFQVNTANGTADSYATRIDRLQLGDIHLRDVDAGIVPGMGGNDILLGMSALQQLEFSQQGGELILRQYP
ncbi:retropepsin-like aspartic protease family protein [Halopseudomonas pelagia]|uniref:retropepsin-like aspartic protease family protein n=1 Tax=Halopseudomonas pelagia TaxID=553151 RepID=UPI0003A250F6|nr:TIGR02281 family clan AA aspartic protease [Halopseudomonas pelagia]|tara:strand:- start:586 stop:1104 length:519 start_codon:yes stop_codon:yes gene_type:complete